MKKSFKVIGDKVDKSIVLQPDEPKFSLIWLHGLGDSSAGFLDFFQMPQSPLHNGARVILLNAPQRPVTINGGMPFSSWYDIRDLSIQGSEETKFNMDELRDSMTIVEARVQSEVRYWQENSGISEDDANKKIFVGGFSQGCAVSLTYALSCKRQLAGAVGFSGHIFESLGLQNKGMAALKLESLPMLVFHGDSDDVLDYRRVKPLYDKHLKGLPNFTFRLIPDLYHSVTEEQLSMASDWMQQLLK